jgi:hypothetical protein
LPTHLPHLPPQPQLAPSPESPVVLDHEPTSDALADDLPAPYEMEADDFGIYRIYLSQPTYDPESLHSLGSLCDRPGLVTSDTDPPARSWWSGIGPDYGPF